MENGIEKKQNSFSSIDTLSSYKSDRKKDEGNSKSESKKNDSTSKEKHLTGFFKNSFKTLSMPKKSYSDKDKNEPSRFLGEGVTFKAKLIGILEVEEARGDRMCQEALFELKMAVRAAGEHKQRINIVIAIDGIRLRDEKTGDCLHHHPVHKISFIAQDVADSRAFGYIFGSPDTSHRFFGIKTDKAASQVVMAMRDLFQAVYELKKREVEMAKQNIEQHQLKYGSSFYLDSVPGSSTKSNNTDQVVRAKQTSREETNKNSKVKTQAVSVIADLMDLELELNSLQQGLSQMERFTPSDPFGPSPSLAKEDPFGDSFTPPPCITTPPPAKLPPPPASGDRRKMGNSASFVASQPELHWFDKETQDLFNTEKNLNTTKEGKENCGPCSLESKSMSSAKDLYDIFVELDPLGTGRSKPYTDKKDFFQELKNPPKKQLKDLEGGVSTNTSTNYSAVPSKLFLESSGERAQDDHLRRYKSMDSNQHITLEEELARRDASNDANSNPFETNFANFASFESGSSTRYSPANMSAIPRRSPNSYARSYSPITQSENQAAYRFNTSTMKTSSSSRKGAYKSMTRSDDIDSPQTESFTSRSPQWKRSSENPSKQKIVIDLRRVLSNVDDTDRENDSPVGQDAMILRNPDVMSPGIGGNVSSDSFESIPEPPPRPITSPIISPPPPLPPKKLQLPVTMKPPPPRPSSEKTSHYDYIENYESVVSRQTLKNGDVHIPPLPAPARKPKASHHDYEYRDSVRHRPHKQYAMSGGTSSTESEYYLTPITKSRTGKMEERRPTEALKPSLNITISQLTSSGFEDLASILRIPASALSKMTLKELTECLSRLTEAECQKLENDINNRNRSSFNNNVKGKYQSLNESFEEDSTTALSNFKVDFNEKFPPNPNVTSAMCPSSAPPQVDKYAVFRELIDQEQQSSSSFNTAVSEPHECEEEEERSPEAENVGGDASAEQSLLNEQKDEDSDRYAALRDITSEKKKDDEGESNTKDNVVDSERIAESKSVSDTCPPEDTSKEISRNSSPVEQLADVNSDASVTVQGGENVCKSSEIVTDRQMSESDLNDSVSKKKDIEEKESSNEKSNNKTEVESVANNEVGKNWAKFDSEQDTKEQDIKAAPPWQDERRKNRRRRTRPIKYKKQMSSGARWDDYNDADDDFEENDDEEEEDEGEEVEDEENDFEDDVNDEDYGDDSEENWESSKKSIASSWDESSWRENGWSDRDSLYDEGEMSPSARYREQQYQLKKRGYHRKYSPHKKSASQSPWEEDSSGWSGSRKRGDVAYREYLKASERTYDARKARTPPWSGSATAERRQRYDPKEQDELTLLKMMLGKKRLKALEEQLFKHYHEQLSEKAAVANLKKYSNKMKVSSSSSLFDREYDELGANAKGTTGRRSAKKYYQTQTRPKSADKGRKPLLLRGDDTNALYGSNTKIQARYRRPYSHDELSISEEEKWIGCKSPTTGSFKKLSSTSSMTSRVRQHSQNSPFEDNFNPSTTNYNELDLDSTADSDGVKKATGPAMTATTENTSLNVLSRSEVAFLTHGRLSSLPQRACLRENNPYASCDNLKYGRTSRDSSQRQSPFEDDFTPSNIQKNSSKECVDRRKLDDDVFSNNEVASPSPVSNISVSVGSASGSSIRINKAGTTRAGRNDKRQEQNRTNSSNKYYENVELWKKIPASDGYSSTRERHGKHGNVKESKIVEMAVRSPKKGKRDGGSDLKRSDPFNDGSQNYESRTVPRLEQKASKTKHQSYDSGSDSAENRNTMKWKDEANSFSFSDAHNRK